jgi:DNA-binding response OmpR family regulator
MLPGRDGLKVCRNLRSSGLTTPIIMITARGQESDKIKALDTGADDYVTKPFNRELLARIRAVLRRPAIVTDANVPPDPYHFGRVTVYFSRHEARKSGRPLDLTPTEFRLLRLLIAHRGRVLTHDEIIATVWGKDAFLSDRVLYTHLNNLRGKIEDNPSEPQFVTGVRGVGYRFDAQIQYKS